MKLDKNILTLYAVTNFDFTDNEFSIMEKIMKIINGGVTCIQLREKTLGHDQFLRRALLIKKICRKNNVTFIVNDNVKVAIESDADGLHIGQDDLNPLEARKLIGNDKILGISVQTVEQAIKAESDGANYLGVGSIFPTYTKRDSSIVSIDTLKMISQIVSIPIVAIGGINFSNIEKLKYTGISGIAVSSAIFLANDIESQTSNLLSYLKNILEI